MKSKAFLISLILLALLLTACSSAVGKTENNVNYESMQSAEVAQTPSEFSSYNETESDSVSEPTTNSNITNDTPQEVIPDESYNETESDSVSEPTTNSNITEDTPQEVIPDESYVGEWVNYPYVGNGTIHILSVSSKSVTFSLGITKGPAVDGTAIMQDGKYVFGEDISPDLHYSLYDWSYKDSTTVSGYLIFKENGVCILFDEYIENSAGLGCNIKYDSYKKREDSVTKIKTELEDNGWSDFQIYSWDLNKDSDWLDKEGNEWCENVEPYSSKDVLITLVVGTTGDVLSAVRIVYDQESDDWNAVDVYYVNLSGKVLQGEELVQFMEDHGKTGMILPADDSDLLEYFS